MGTVFDPSRRSTDRRQEAEELVQDTFLQAFRAWMDRSRELAPAGLRDRVRAAVRFTVGGQLSRPSARFGP